jgi:hypothetical protein
MSPTRTLTHEGEEIPRAVRRIVDETPILDIHTHLFPPTFGDMLLWGIDELLTYHYLVAEFLRVTDIPYDEFWSLPKSVQAERIWQTLFIERSPVSEATRGVVTVLAQLGLPLVDRNLNAYREWFAKRSLDFHIKEVWEKANVRKAIMTNDPFDPVERTFWEKNTPVDKRFWAALRIDPLLNNWPQAAQYLASLGYAVKVTLEDPTLAEVQRFLAEWLDRMQAKYAAISLPPDFEYPGAPVTSTLLEKALLPVLRDRNLPLALMIGVKRGVNPQLRLAGDGVGTADVSTVERLCAAFPGNKFMVTMLARENQHALCVAARKFRNLLVFGCWWFLNNPRLILEMTQMRLEMLGTSVVLQHSDARVLEQLIYKWAHFRSILAMVLQEKYAYLASLGWDVHEEEMRRDIRAVLGGYFEDFLELRLP